ncbi:MAG TPA: hypothetical protein VKS79_02105 [Gemmataceae bacterium]|nr:hypothetical protein [Gemmataceae bacterium]
MSPSISMRVRIGSLVSILAFAAFGFIGSTTAQEPKQKKDMPPLTERLPPGREAPKPLTPAEIEAMSKDLTPAQVAALTKTKAKLYPEAGDDELRKLLKERYASAIAEFDLTRAREDIVPDKTVWLDSLIASHRSMVETALELLSSPEEQALIVAEHLRKAVDLDRSFKDRIERGLALPQDYYRAHGYRLDVEIKLVKIRRKIEAQQPGAKKEQPKPVFLPQDEGLHKLYAKLEKLDPGNDQLRKLQIERWNRSLQRYDLARAKLGTDFSPLPAIYECYRNALMAALELTDSPAEQISLLEQLVVDAKRQEDDIRIMVDAKRQEGGGRIMVNGIFRSLPQYLEEARDRRLGFEILLLKVKRKADPNYGDAELRKLHEDMLACAKKEYDLIKAPTSLVGDTSTWVQELLTCHRRLLDCGLELSQSSEEKLALINASLKEAREPETAWGDRLKKPWLQPYDEQNVLVHRLDLEILLAEINQASNPNAPESGQTDLAKLLKVRLRAAKEAGDIFKARRGNSLGGYPLWLQLFLEFRRKSLVYALEAAPRDADREATIRSVTNEMIDLEQDFERQVKVHQALPQSLELVRDQRLEFEILIAKSKRAAKAEK